ncbi:MAG: DNA integrity scanning protein DisA nucleotide-binding domain protein [Clostridia bacterium]|nr:DNA integrity scanning protein DisA nucleotide-binding domain protein [Clostridia bacterium]
MQLLATTFFENAEQLFDSIGIFFQNFSFWYVLETLLLFLLLFYVSKILYDNDASKVMFFYWALIIIGGIFMLAESKLFNKQFSLIYVLVVSVFFLVIFHVEVKKSLWDKHGAVPSREKTAGAGTEVHSVQEVERCIENIIKALQNMSKNNVGALVVLSRGNLPRQVLQSGVPLNAEISTQLLEGVFFPKAPLHDGAVIIRGHKIQAAGCFLPLTQKTSYPKDFGTRHRAGIGITEVANVISIVVSEETGIISVIKAGVVQRYADYDVLMTALRDYYWQELPLATKK